VRKLAVEASDNAYWRELANGITRVKGVASRRPPGELVFGRRRRRCSTRRMSHYQGLRDRAILAYSWLRLRPVRGGGADDGHVHSETAAGASWISLASTGACGQSRCRVGEVRSKHGGSAGVCDGPVFRSMNRGTKPGRLSERSSGNCFQPYAGAVCPE